MGQYHIPCNIDRREFIHPHTFGDGLKLLEFGPSGSGTMMGLAVLLAASNRGGPRGGGDLHPWHGGAGYEGCEVSMRDDEDALMAHIVGRWAGQRIAIIGDYAETDDVDGMDVEDTPFSNKDGWTDITALVIATMELDHYTHQERSTRRSYGEDGPTPTLDPTTGTIS